MFRESNNKYYTNEYNQIMSYLKGKNEPKLFYCLSS